VTHPWLCRRVVYPLHERLLARPTLRYAADMERSQWLSRAAVEQLQMTKLHKLLATAARHSPWHAERIRAGGIDLDADRASVSLDQLRRLPTMTRRDARENLERLWWKDAPGGAFKYTTGGSSGQPLIFYFGRARQAADAAGRIRARRWWGLEVGDREVCLWGAPVELENTDRIKTVRDRLLNQLLLNAFEMSARTMDDYLDAIQTYRPRCIFGYASSLALLAARARSQSLRLRLPTLRVVCTTGEPLYSHQRALLEQVFGTPVASEYGSRDVGFNAHETPQAQLLLASENVIMEVLDEAGRPVPVGELGEAVMTGLHSEVQPFIRYRTGDMVRLSNDSCRDGRGLHVLSEVVGRTTDFVVRSDGTVMHALAVIYVLRAVGGIAEFKFVQHTLDDAEVLVVPTADWGEHSSAEILKGLKARLGKSSRITVRLVDEIAPEKSGKYRYVVSHVPPRTVVDGSAELTQVVHG